MNELKKWMVTTKYYYSRSLRIILKHKAKNKKDQKSCKVSVRDKAFQGSNLQVVQGNIEEN